MEYLKQDLRWYKKCILEGAGSACGEVAPKNACSAELRFRLACPKISRLRR
mgnify:CR=1 FL=1|jgi:hypothetical protein